MAAQNNIGNPVYSGAHFMVEIDGIGKGVVDLPTLRSLEGGGVKADVLSYQMGDKGDIWRQLGKPKYDDIKMTFGLADVEGFRSWIYDFLQGRLVRKSGAIIAADANYKERARRKFTEALLCSVGLPKWDANDKNPANITITISPEKVTYEGPSGATIAPREMSEARQQKIPACNFKFSIDGFPGQVAETCVKVEAMEIKVKMIEHHYGTRLEAVKIPGKIEWPNLVFHVPEADAEPFRKLHNERMAGTRADQGQGRGAMIQFFNNAMARMGEIQFTGVHIFNVQTEKSDASNEELKLTKIECAIEGIVITETGKWVTAPAK